MKKEPIVCHKCKTVFLMDVIRQGVKEKCILPFGWQAIGLYELRSEVKGYHKMTRLLCSNCAEPNNSHRDLCQCGHGRSHHHHVIGSSNIFNGHCGIEGCWCTSFASIAPEYVGQDENGGEE